VRKAAACVAQRPNMVHTPTLPRRRNAGVITYMYTRISSIGAGSQRGAALRICTVHQRAQQLSEPQNTRLTMTLRQSQTNQRLNRSTMNQAATQLQPLHRLSSPSFDDGDIDSSIVIIPHTETPNDTLVDPSSASSEAIQLIAESKQYQQSLLITIDCLKQDNAALVSELAKARETDTRLQSVLQQRIQELSDKAQPPNREPVSSQLPAANEKRTGASILLKRLMQMEPLLLSLFLLLAVVTSLQFQHHSRIVASLNQDKAALQLANAEREAQAKVAAATERAELQAELLKMRKLKDEMSDKVGVLERRITSCDEAKAKAVKAEDGARAKAAAEAKANAEREARAKVAAATERAELQAELLLLKDEMSDKVGVLERRLKYCSARDQEYMQIWTSLGADAVAAERARLEKTLDAKGWFSCRFSCQLLRNS
jgi:hypothetical protein